MHQREELYLGDIFIQHLTSEVKQIDREKNALIYFHGFPGPVPGNPNKPIANLLREATSDLDIDVIAPFYRGISESKGKYQFSGSLADGMMVLDWVLEQGYKNVSILGYSWGAQVAFPAFISLPDEIRGKLVLMSPATFIPENSSLEQLVKEWRDFTPWLLEHTTDEEIIADIATIIKTNPMNEIAKKLNPADIHIIQAPDDDTIPQKITDYFVSLLSGAPTSYRKIHGGHEFINRDLLKQSIREIFLMRTPKR